MTSPLLERLKSDEFQVPLAFIATAPALRRALRRRQEVQEIVAALTAKVIAEESLREFTNGLLRDLKPGEKFPHELAVSALAVALEGRPTAFADEFLHDLANLHLAEMSMSIRVARECLGQHEPLAVRQPERPNAHSQNAHAELEKAEPPP
jgi:hypothetical protein